jgi:hypothetical protein
MEAARKVHPDIHILPSSFTVPNIGTLPINAFVLKAEQPVLIDTGLKQDSDAFISALESVIDPADLKWLWLTHPDPDHIGSLMPLLERVPGMRLITTFLGVGIMSLTMDVPLHRVYLLNPGETIDVGDRVLTAVKPPTFDNPSTTGFYDSKSRTFFSSDCFGGLLSGPAEDARDVAADALRQGQVAWTTVDSPWLHKVDESKFAAELNTIRAMDPARVLSSHLPPAEGMTDTLLEALVDASHAQPFVGPNQAALEAMLAQMTGAPAGSTA